MTKTHKVVTSVIVSLVVGLAFLGFTQPSVPTNGPTENVGSGGNVTSQVDVYTNGVGIGPEYATFSRSGTIGAGANQGSWCNLSSSPGLGRTAYIDLATITTSGTASSSFKFYIATSTTARISNDFTAPFGSLINGFTIATSSPATTTSSIEQKRSGFAVIPVTVGQCVVTQMQASNGSVCASVGGLCESATSTNRGFNIDWYLRGYYNDAR